MPQGLTTVFTEPGKPFELETLPTPEIETGGILIKTFTYGAAMEMVRHSLSVESSVTSSRALFTH